MPRLDIEDKQQIISLNNENKSLFETSATLNLSKASRYNVIHHFNSRSHLANKKARISRPKKVTKRKGKN